MVNLSHLFDKIARSNESKAKKHITQSTNNITHIASSNNVPSLVRGSLHHNISSGGSSVSDSSSKTWSSFEEKSAYQDRAMKKLALLVKQSESKVADTLARMNEQTRRHEYEIRGLKNENNELKEAKGIAEISSVLENKMHRIDQLQEDLRKAERKIMVLEECNKDLIEGNEEMKKLVNGICEAVPNQSESHDAWEHRCTIAEDEISKISNRTVNDTKREFDWQRRCKEAEESNTRYEYEEGVKGISHLIDQLERKLFLNLNRVAQGY